MLQFILSYIYLCLRIFYRIYIYLCLRRADSNYVMLLSLQMFSYINVYLANIIFIK